MNADEDVPEGSVIDGTLVRRDVSEEVDFVVVGSGAAGAVAAHTLTEAGFEVAIVEEGPWVRTREFVEEVYPSVKRLAREAGTQMMMGRAFIPMVQGRCVGGATLLNSGIAWRVPEDVLVDWSRRFGLGASILPKDLEPHFEALERDLSVRPVDAPVLGENSRLLLEHASRAGFTATVMRRYDAGCRGTGRCMTGCPHGAKQSMNVTYVPWALRRGARIYTSCRVERVEVRRGRAVGVVARAEGAVGREGPRVLLRVRRGVVLAASAVQTPGILRRSGVKNEHLGRHFMAHPGVAVAGLFDKPIHMMSGATQGAESIQFRVSKRFKPETLAMQPELAAVRVPGVGRELVRRLGSFSHVAVWAVQIRARAEGRVTGGLPLLGTRETVVYSPREDDVRIAREAVTLLVRTMFEAGAREVWPGIVGVPPVLRSADEARALADAPLHPGAYVFASTHYFGTARLGRDRSAGVVGRDFQVHDVAGLHVVDSSVFPTNLGVNPQHTIMAVSRLAATRLAAGRAAFAA